MRIVDIKYKCRCMDKEASLLLRARGADEPIEAFMGRLQTGLLHERGQLRPQCKCETMEYVKIFLPPDGTVGGAEGGNA